ncbi:putative membrane protein precursor [Moritella sp. JT01]|uniref:CPBP family intramembrane glutamic endopeptidase n=1 Tax=Moritella sp. JT01 TaxID=756698 RepID=UPI00079B7F16|nr:CPBP family intramembrane glutamic endopeptidase [Moritella sp. JT01]KXO08001.1 putative membrane protein precursor [Moritella sp. JT01]
MFTALITPDISVWFLLSITIFSLFIRSSLWPFLLSITLITAYFLDRISIIGISFVLFGLAISIITKNYSKGKIAVIGHAIVLAWSIALVLHLIPGFNNLLVLDKVITGPQSIPFTMYLNLDKPMIIFALLLLVPSMMSNSEFSWSSLKLTNTKYYVLIIGFILLPLLAFLFSLVKPELTLPAWWWLFAFNNLLFTCVAEEVLFRGYIQRQLGQYISPWVGIVITSILFGLAHFSGGPFFILVATLAGGLYGLTYHWTGKLSAAILMHFAFNFVHFVFFTYPIAK